MQYAISYVHGPCNTAGLSVGTREYWTGTGWSTEVGRAKLYDSPTAAFRGIAGFESGAAGTSMKRRPNQYTVRIVEASPSYRVRLKDSGKFGGDHYIAPCDLQNRVCAVQNRERAAEYGSTSEALAAIVTFGREYPVSRWVGYIIESSPSSSVTDVTREWN